MASVILRRRLRGWMAVPALRLLVVLFGRLPWRAAQELGGWLGLASWVLNRRDRRRAVDHVGIAYPDLGLDHRRRLARASFRHLGRSGGELLHLRHRPAGEAGRHTTVVGFEEIDAVLARGRPVVLLTAHCGNWELIGSLYHSHGLRVVAMTRGLQDGGLHRLAMDIRAHLGTETIVRGSMSSSRRMLKVLRSGGVLAMLIDQDFATGGVFVPFFGRPAHTPAGPAEIALRLDAAVVPVFDQRLEDGSHLLRFGPAMELPRDATAATAAMTTLIEAQIRRCPEQWVWLHRRWRRRPPGEAGAVDARP